MKLVNHEKVGLWLDPEEYQHLRDIDGNTPLFQSIINPLEYAVFDGYTNHVFTVKHDESDTPEIIDEILDGSARLLYEKEKANPTIDWWHSSDDEIYPFSDDLDSGFALPMEEFLNRYPKESQKLISDFLTKMIKSGIVRNASFNDLFSMVSNSLKLTPTEKKLD